MPALEHMTQNPQLTGQIGALAQAAGLEVLTTTHAEGIAGLPTLQFALTLAAEPTKAMQLELSQGFQPERFSAEIATYLAEAVRRLKNPRPDCYLTTQGLPLRFSGFAWPFHESTAGADTSLVHGRVDLEDGTGSPLHSKISASMTVTFREALRAPEQPFAESFIFNAVRKTFDQGQLELVKSGNRQPVPVTTRYYSARQNKFVFTDTKEDQRTAFLAAKAFWLSGKLGGGAPVWLADPRDAQYLNATPAELMASVKALVAGGAVTASSDPEFVTPTASLMAKESEYLAELAEALAFIKPSFNEDMRGGLTNM